MPVRKLKFSDTQSVAADVLRLRQGYSKTGNWSLQQICWHLNKAVSYSMRPGPHQTVRAILPKRAALWILLTFSWIPKGRKGPDRVMPAADVPESAVDDFLAVLPVLNNFTGPFAPHPLFGSMDVPQYKRFHMVHCAHHLGHLVPANG